MKNDSYFPITNSEELLDKVKKKVAKEMEEEINIFGDKINTNDLLKVRKNILNRYDMFYIKNLIYQRIMNSKVEDYIFGGYVLFPTKTFNIMLDDSVNILQNMYDGGCYLFVSHLDDINRLNNDFVTIIEECVIEDKWRKNEKIK